MFFSLQEVLAVFFSLQEALVVFFFCWKPWLCSLSAGSLDLIFFSGMILAVFFSVFTGYIKKLYFPGFFLYLRSFEGCGVP